MTTTPSEPIADEDLVPAATASTPDLICWIWAAFPPHQGHINKTRVAETLGVSRRTLGRWLEDAEAIVSDMENFAEKLDRQETTVNAQQDQSAASFGKAATRLSTSVK